MARPKKQKMQQEQKSYLDTLRSDFRTFLYLVHRHLDLPVPTPVQLDMANYIANGPKRSMVQAFRGVGKSHITSAYVVWRLLRNPDDKIMVVSASKDRADQFSTFTQRLIAELPGLDFLKPSGEQRNSKIAFDVGPAKASQFPSVKSVGITGQMTGSRADLLIADDVEVLNNAATQQMRDKLGEVVKEFDAILKPTEGSRILYLGTPQCEDSLYNKLPERGYDLRIWPARMPGERLMENYGHTLAPFIAEMGLKEGEATDPKRFDDTDLIEREASYGKSGFALQYMLNTQLSDAERHPLRLRDLIVMNVDSEKAPSSVSWGPIPDKALDDLPNVGMRGDKFFPPAQQSDLWLPFDGCVMAIDPSGRGQDETGFAIVKMLNSTVYVVDAGGLPGGYSVETMRILAHKAMIHQVNEVVIESNFGDGMYTQLFTPVLVDVHNVAVKEVRNSVQKERRIIDTLEPVIARHRLVISPEVVREDWNTILPYDNHVKLQKSLFYQLTRITYDKGSLRYDDRLDALSMAVGYWVEQMAADQKSNEDAAREMALEKELSAFMEHATGRKSAGASWLNYGRR